MVTDDKYVYVGSHWDKLIAYDKATGKTAWSNDTEGLKYRSTTPAEVKDTLYVAAESSVLKVDRNSGKIISKYTFDGYNFDAASAPYIEDNIGYFTTATKGVVAIDMNCGSMLWNFETGDALVFTSPYTSKGSKTVDSSIVGYKGGLLFGASDGVVYLLEKDGSVREQKDLGSPVLNSLAVDGDVVYAFDFSGNLTAFDIG